MNELNKEAFGTIPDRFTNNINNALQKVEKPMKKKLKTTIVLAIMIILLLATAAYAVVLRIHYSTSTVDKRSGEVIGSSTSTEVTMTQLEEKLQEREMVLLLPAYLPDDFAGSPNPDSIVISKNNDLLTVKSETVAGVVTNEDERYRVEYTKLTDNDEKSLVNGFTKANIWYVSATGKEFGIICWIYTEADSAHRLENGGFSTTSNGNRIEKSEYDFTTPEGEVLQWAQLYMFADSELKKSMLEKEKRF